MEQQPAMNLKKKKHRQRAEQLVLLYEPVALGQPLLLTTQ